MPRKTYKGKRGTKSTKRRTRSISRTRSKSRKYRGRGGCQNGSCVIESNAPIWTTKGGCTISKDIYDHTTDRIFYSPAN